MHVESSLKSKVFWFNILVYVVLLKDLLEHPAFNKTYVHKCGMGLGLAERACHAPAHVQKLMPHPVVLVTEEQAITLHMVHPGGGGSQAGVSGNQGAAI